MPETNRPIRLYADFNNADRLGRVRLTVKGTRDDLVALGIELQSGLSVELYDDDEIETPGRVEWSPEDGWVAVVDWDAIRRWIESNDKSRGGSSE